MSDLYLGTNHFSALVVGSTGSGKSSTLKEFVEKLPDLTGNTDPILVVWIYNLQKPKFKVPPSVELLLKRGLPTVQQLLSLAKEKSDVRIVVIFDDCLTLFQTASHDLITSYGSLITEYGRRGFTLFFVCQVSKSN